MYITIISATDVSKCASVRKPRAGFVGKLIKKTVTRHGVDTSTGMWKIVDKKVLHYWR